MRPGGFGLFGPRRRRDPERGRRTAKILLVAGAVLAAATVVQFVIVSRTSAPAPHAHDCSVPAGAEPGAGTPPGNIPALVAPLGTPAAAYTHTTKGQTVHVFCWNEVSEPRAQAALTAVVKLGYLPADEGDPVHTATFTSDTAVPYAIRLDVSDGLDLAHAGTGSGHLAISWIDHAPARS
ncbi:MAG: hypothetical protein EPN43_05780 [Jatrophihabitans sp.]|nr:MAG: hypothetical protein EPN43_05780 [Jatrophihabitans sp.]